MSWICKKYNILYSFLLSVKQTKLWHIIMQFAGKISRGGTVLANLAKIYFIQSNILNHYFANFPVSLMVYTLAVATIMICLYLLGLKPTQFRPLQCIHECKKFTTSSTNAGVEIRIFNRSSCCIASEASNTSGGH